jgi:hypothetical protein
MQTRHDPLPCGVRHWEILTDQAFVLRLLPLDVAYSLGRGTHVESACINKVRSVNYSSSPAACESFLIPRLSQNKGPERYLLKPATL